MQVDEQLPVREPVLHQVSDVHGQGSLPYAGHPVDRVDRHEAASADRASHRGGDAVQFAVPARERRRVRRQRVPHRQRARPRDGSQGVEQLKLKIGVGGECPDDQPGIAQPLPERFHHRGIGISESRR